MPLYDYRCDCGVQFEIHVPSWNTPNPPCPLCDRATRRMPAAPAFHTGAKPPPGPNEAPASYEGVGMGDRETITRWRRQLDQHAKLAEKHPELQVKREAIAAHEGAFANRPLSYRELAQRAAPSGDADTGARAAAKERASESPAKPHRH